MLCGLSLTCKIVLVSCLSSRNQRLSGGTAQHQCQGHACYGEACKSRERHCAVPSLPCSLKLQEMGCGEGRVAWGGHRQSGVLAGPGLGVCQPICPSDAGFLSPEVQQTLVTGERAQLILRASREFLGLGGWEVQECGQLPGRKLCHQVSLSSLQLPSLLPQCMLVSVP